MTQPLASTPAFLGPSIPHGGELVNLLLSGAEKEDTQRRAASLVQIPLTRSIQRDLELLAVGAYSPLKGFLTQGDFTRVVRESRLADGTLWPIPIGLPLDPEASARLRKGQEVALTDGTRPLALLRIEDLYGVDQREVAEHVYGTEDQSHPGVARLFAQSSVQVGGPIQVFERPRTVEFPEYHLDPRETRLEFDTRGWKSVVGFQTRNPIHRAHEFIQKSALEIVDGLFIHPLVGETKRDDIPPDVRMRCYERLLEGYYPAERVKLGVFPATMRYAGPREALFHALVRKNYGCTHFIVGRDHAGVGNFYGTYDAQRFFDRFTPAELGITPLPFEHTFFCHVCAGMASLKTCPHDADHRLTLSGTRIREMLRNGETPPAEYTRPEVARILIDAMRPLGRRTGRSTAMTSLSPNPVHRWTDSLRNLMKKLRELPWIEMI